MDEEVCCQTCNHFYQGADGDYMGGYYYSQCLLIDGLEEHPDFPFDEPPGCYDPCFWLSRYGDLQEGTGEELRRNLDDYGKAIEVSPPRTPPSKL